MTSIQTSSSVPAAFIDLLHISSLFSLLIITAVGSSQTFNLLVSFLLCLISAIYIALTRIRKSEKTGYSKTPNGTKYILLESRFGNAQSFDFIFKKYIIIPKWMNNSRFKAAQIAHEEAHIERKDARFYSLVLPLLSALLVSFLAYNVYAYTYISGITDNFVEGGLFERDAPNNKASAYWLVLIFVTALPFTSFFLIILSIREREYLADLAAARTMPTLYKGFVEYMNVRAAHSKKPLYSKIYSAITHPSWSKRNTSLSKGFGSLSILSFYSGFFLLYNIFVFTLFGMGIFIFVASDTIVAFGAIAAMTESNIVIVMAMILLLAPFFGLFSIMAYASHLSMQISEILTSNNFVRKFLLFASGALIPVSIFEINKILSFFYSGEIPAFVSHDLLISLLLPLVPLVISWAVLRKTLRFAPKSFLVHTVAYLISSIILGYFGLIWNSAGPN